MDDDRPPGSSMEQREAERVMLDRLGERFGLPLHTAPISVTPGTRIEVDGVSADRTVLVECWAHQGTVKAAQRHKVLADAFKLTWIAATLNPRPRLVLCLSDQRAAEPFRPGGRSWAARALEDFGIEVIVVDLPDELRQRLIRAQERQYR